MLKFKFNVIILLLLIMSILTGCHGQYKAERDFYLANRKYRRILQQIDSTKKEEFQGLIVEFRKILLIYPTGPRSADAQLKIGNLYNAQNKQDKAIDEYKKVIENFPNSTEASSRALFAIGGVYQIKGDDEKAKLYFNKALEDYPKTKVALDIPLYLARYYRVKEKHDESDTAYNDAINRYRSIIDENPDSAIGIYAIDYLVSCYGDRNRWQEAISVLGEIEDKYPQSASALKSLFVMGRIYEAHLKDKQKAEEVYKEMIERFPDSALSQSVKEYLNSPR